MLGLDEISTTGGVSLPNFFNGRILSAEDLRRLGRGDRLHRRQLANAMGTGVAYGLRVDSPDAGGGVVRVSAGSAINIKGDVVTLGADVDLSLGGVAKEPIQVSSGVFFECGDLTSSIRGESDYLLTVRPDSVLEGSAPADPYLAGDSCGPGLETDGVRFRRVNIDAVALAGAQGIPDLPADGEIRRNLLAHAFFATPRRHRSFDGIDDASIDLLGGVDECEVPLALFRIVDGNVVDLDEWPARRMLHQPGESSFLSELLSSSAPATAQAVFAQFQRHLAELNAPVLAQFRFLPAAVVLPQPLLGPGTVEAIGPDTVPFLGDLGGSEAIVHPRPMPIPADRVESIVRQSMYVSPVDLAAGRGLPLTLLPVTESFGPGEPTPYGLLVSSAHPICDRIRVERLEEVVEGLKSDLPPPDEPVLRVRAISVKTGPHEAGNRFWAVFKIETNIAGVYQLDGGISWLRGIPPTDRIANVAAIAGDPGAATQLTLSEGETLVQVNGLIRFNFLDSFGDSGFAKNEAIPFFLTDRVGGTSGAGAAGFGPGLGGTAATAVDDPGFAPVAVAGTTAATAGDPVTARARAGAAVDVDVDLVTAEFGNNKDVIGKQLFPEWSLTLAAAGTGDNTLFDDASRGFSVR